jgi:hypothetical protein
VFHLLQVPRAGKTFKPDRAICNGKSSCVYRCDLTESIRPISPVESALPLGRLSNRALPPDNNSFLFRSLATNRRPLFLLSRAAPLKANHQSNPNSFLFKSLTADHRPLNPLQIFIAKSLHLIQVQEKRGREELRSAGLAPLALRICELANWANSRTPLTPNF